MVWKDFLGRSYRDDERASAASRLAEKCGYAAAALTIVPIPGSELLAVMPIHVGMVVGIAHIYGFPMTKQSASELAMRIFATAGLSLVGSRVATTAAKLFLPGLGGLVAAPLIFASTIALGAVARAHFERGGDLDDEEMRFIYERARRDARTRFDPVKMRSEEAQKTAEALRTSEDPGERLARLKDLLKRGLIDKEEHDATRARILAEL